MLLVRNLPRTARTLRHLRLRQLAARSWLQLRYRLYKAFPFAASTGFTPSAKLNESGLRCIERWQCVKRSNVLSERSAQRAREAAGGCFTFLNRSRHYGATVDWMANDMSRLWQYHLHYGDYIPDLVHGAERLREPGWTERAWALIEDWERANPPGCRPAWEPYPLSLRIVNWTSAAGALRRGQAAGERWPRLLRLLHRQATYLARHLEYHLGGNHLIKNAKAMWVAGLLFDDATAMRWRQRGMQLLLSELRQQILPDGGHYERSPMYHGVVLDDVLDCLVLAREVAEQGFPPGGASIEELTETARRMVRWFQAMLHSDRGLALFNDSVVGAEPDPGELLAYAARVLPYITGGDEAAAVTELRTSGYYILCSGKGRMVIDCGEIGPDDLPAHAHADTLSYEFTWDGQRLVVDSGIAEYAPGELRQYVRSTRAHNTVVVDGREQSETWASHRVGRRAYPVAVETTYAADVVRFTGAHDGYAWLGVLHHRHVLAYGNLWVVVDELLGHGRHRFENFIHFHPSVMPRPGKNGYLLSVPDLPDLRLEWLGDQTVSLEQGRYCPDWNCVFPNPVAVLAGETELPATFGYFLAPAELDVRLRLSSDARGVSVLGQAGGQAVHMRSERCVSSF